LSRVVRDWKCSYYSNVEATESITLADIGEVWAGTEGSVVIFIRNDERGFVRDIVYTVLNPAITLVGPKRLEAGEVGSISIKWSPSESTEQGLEDEPFTVEGTVVL